MNPVRIVADELHPEVAGWWCAGMPEHWYMAIRLKWGRDRSSNTELNERLLVIAKKIAARGNWRLSKDRQYLERMVSLAIMETCDPARFSYPDSYKIRMAWIGCSKTKWFSTWQQRYERVYVEFNDWSDRGFRYLKVRQKDNSVKETLKLVK